MRSREAGEAGSGTQAGGISRFERPGLFSAIGNASRIDAYGLDMQVMSPTSSGVPMQSTDSLLAAGSGLISGLSAVIAPLSQLASVAPGDKGPSRS
jgi:hypothetical protein